MGFFFYLNSGIIVCPEVDSLCWSGWSEIICRFRESCFNSLPSAVIELLITKEELSGSSLGDFAHASIRTFDYELVYSRLIGVEISTD